MSLLQMMSNDWWDDFEYPFSISPFLDTNKHKHDRRRNYLQPWSSKWIQSLDSGDKLVLDKDKFHVIVDVQQFNPNEITVKTADKQVIVEAKHEEKPDEQGYIYRHFIRRYQLPDDADPEDVASTLSSDGVLTIAAVRKPPEIKETVIPVTHTNS